MNKPRCPECGDIMCIPVLWTPESRDYRPSGWFMECRCGHRSALVESETAARDLWRANEAPA